MGPSLAKWCTKRMDDADADVCKGAGAGKEEDAETKRCQNLMNQLDDMDIEDNLDEDCTELTEKEKVKMRLAELLEYGGDELETSCEIEGVSNVCPTCGQNKDLQHGMEPCKRRRLPLAMRRKLLVTTRLKKCCPLNETKPSGKRKLFAKF